ncbi:MAG: alpha-glucan family phosphorylase [Halanaerobiaceae bacterium]
MANKNQDTVAYFCMEYGIDDSLPLYAGGLGILAGDILKSAHDRGMPMVGIGIKWWQNYTTQLIDKNTGYPYDVFPVHELDFLEDTGKEIYINLRDEKITCRIYKVTGFGNVPLYLLDTGHPETDNGWITDKLYSGNQETRIAQEILLGIGGIKALRRLGLDIDKYHFNEGHAAFAGLELIREMMEEEGLSFEAALSRVKAKIVFTTHTPVKAGNEAHDINQLIELGANNGFSYQQLERIGGDPFNMTAACLRMSNIANGVSKLHGRTARDMWDNLDDKAPIISITNGVHRKTWQEEKIADCFEKKENLWQTHMELKKKMIEFIHDRAGAELNPENLIIGFARRAAPYKRSELIFRDTEQIKEYLLDGRLQLVFSGKAHPEDKYGKDTVAKLVEMDQKYRDSVVFLENYNIEIARHLTRGCDVWLNNPRRPLEASGTSGMKAAMNGVLNLSVMDGWVAEGLNHGTTGWLLDEVFPELNDSLGEDEKDLRALYRIVRENVIPVYYQDRKKWVDMMYSSIEMAAYDYSAGRMLDEYFDRMYSRKMEPAGV